MRDQPPVRLLNLENTFCCCVSSVTNLTLIDEPFKMHLSGDILQASDDLSHVINSYKKIVKRQTFNGETEEAQNTQTSVKQGKFNWQ